MIVRRKQEIIIPQWCMMQVSTEMVEIFRLKPTSVWTFSWIRSLPALWPKEWFFNPSFSSKHFIEEMSALPSWNNLAHAVAAMRSRWVINTVVVITQSCCVSAVLSSVASFNRHPTCIIEAENRVLRSVPVYTSWIGCCFSWSACIIEVY
jgi:hypothetical protein